MLQEKFLKSVNSFEPGLECALGGKASLSDVIGDEVAVIIFRRQTLQKHERQWPTYTVKHKNRVQKLQVRKRAFSRR